MFGGGRVAFAVVLPVVVPGWGEERPGPGGAGECPEAEETAKAGAGAGATVAAVAPLCETYPGVLPGFPEGLCADGLVEEDGCKSGGAEGSSSGGSAEGEGAMPG